MKSFLKSVIDVINVADQQTNIALITYNTRATLRFNLDRYHTRFDLKTNIDKLVYTPTSSSNASDALRMAREQVFSQNSPGNRDDLPNVLVLITNRGSSSLIDTTEQARLLKLAGVSIITIGINNWLNVNELVELSSDPPSSYVNILNSFDDLSSLKTKLQTTICSGGLLKTIDRCYNYIKLNNNNIHIFY